MNDPYYVGNDDYILNEDDEFDDAFSQPIATRPIPTVKQIYEMPNRQEHVFKQDPTVGRFIEKDAFPGKENFSLIGGTGNFDDQQMWNIFFAIMLVVLVVLQIKTHYKLYKIKLSLRKTA